ncbi:MAG: hypothetical protein KDC38_17770 [Planctomycetes bacterium]|nr:hypothetical protein [Planctomycetota bacterium]
MKERLDAVRQVTLDQIERNAIYTKVLVAIAVAMDVGGLVAFLSLMDFSNRDHVLLLIATCLIYWTLGIWTWAMATHSSGNSKRVLRGLSLLQAELERREV